MSILNALTLSALLVAPQVALAAPAPAGVVTQAFSGAIPNIPGKSVTGVVVTYPPGGRNGAHRHAKSAYITAYVLSGAIRSSVDDAPPKVFKAGESWTEQPGAHHTLSENASTTEPASLLAIFVLDSSETQLTTPDAR